MFTPIDKDARRSNVQVGRMVTMKQHTMHRLVSHNTGTGHVRNSVRGCSSVIAARQRVGGLFNRNARVQLIRFGLEWLGVTEGLKKTNRVCNIDESTTRQLQVRFTPVCF